MGAGGLEVKRFAITAAILAGLVGAPGTAGAEIDQGGSHVQGWHMAGSEPAAYEFARTGGNVDGAEVVRLRSVAPTATAEGFGTMMQSITATNYLGSRLRLSGELKAEGVTGWAGLWVRVDGEQGRILAFDNMSDRPITGTTGWTGCDVVLDVDSAAHDIAFGVLLNGPGAVDITKLGFEKVGADVPVTGRPPVTEPVNLDFRAG